MKLSVLLPHLNEKQRRLLAAAEARELGYGGIQQLSEITGISRPTIYRGLEELVEEVDEDSLARVRNVGGGRKKITEKSPEIVDALESLIEPSVRGDPESPLRWTCKSVRLLEQELNKQGYKISYQSMASVLKELEYSLQANQKTSEGKSHPDRDGQFMFINKRAKWFLSRNFPVISVDTKKKELVGKYKNNGREWSKKGGPQKVKVHDFPDSKVPKAVPYGVYDIGRNEGWVNLGISSDTAQFAVESIRQWWIKMGSKRYPKAKKILICADSGGSNSYRSHLWKWELYKFAKRHGLSISVCHYPPGTSKWNKIEHKMFSFISIKWRGRPLLCYQTIVKLLAATKTKSGLSIKSRLDKKKYKKGIKISKDQLREISMRKDSFHGEWNYTIL